MKTIKRSDIEIMPPRFKSSGHYELCICHKFDLDFEPLTCITTNMSIVDDWNEDDMYFEDNNSGHWYDSQEAVEQAIIDEISRKNDIIIE